MDSLSDKQTANLNSSIDLAQIFDKINMLYFDGKLDCAIMFGRKYQSPRKRCIRLGSYNVSNNTIRINPDLNDPEVPVFLIEYIVYHEMTHAWCYANHSKLRHRGQFHTKEKEFVNFKTARKWLRDNKKIFFKRIR